MKRPFTHLTLRSLAAGLVLVGLYHLPHALSPVLVMGYLLILVPLECLLLPLLAARKGLTPYAAFFPPLVCIGLALVVLRLAPPVWVLPLCFFLSLVGSNIGQELYQRTPEET